jgi:poly-gamma-glutamate synthesis protein (capsule biosynthesis protein)
MVNFNIIFTGDLSLTGVFNSIIKEKGEIFNDDIIKTLANSSFTVCNFEGPATQELNYLRSDTCVVSPIESIKYLKDRNFNVFNLANNHTFDCGVKGFKDTIDNIQNNSAYYFGAGHDIIEASRILYLKKNNIRLALIGICHPEGMLASSQNPGVFCIKDYSIIKRKLKEARKNADWSILCYHGGEEYTTIPMPQRRKLLHKIAKLDLDIIICHHSHVFQGYEKIKNTQIFYSLGNFIFDINAFYKKEFTYEGALLKIKFTKEDYTFEFIPTKIDINQKRIISGNNNFLDHIKNISEFENYRNIWLKDAYRTFFQPNIEIKKNIDKNNKISYISKHLKVKDIAPMLVNFTYYQEIFKILKKPNRRSIFIGSLFYLLIKKLQKIK